MSADRRMLGRLGWHGQCGCCNGPRDEKPTERREWKADALSELLDYLDSVGIRRHEYDLANPYTGR